ncbi:hypothetical protein Tco_1155524 [Tanacetum coccineum]
MNAIVLESGFLNCCGLCVSVNAWSIMWTDMLFCATCEVMCIDVWTKSGGLLAGFPMACFWKVNEARGAKDTLGIHFWRVITSWDCCYDLKSLLSIGADEELSDGGSPRVIVCGYDGLPMQPVAPTSQDYVPGPKHPPSPIEVPYVPEPEYPKYLVPSDAEVPLEDQPLPADASPTALSPGYVADSDPNEDPKEDPEEDHDEEPFEDEDDDEEEEEHLAPANPSVVPVVDLIPSAGDIEAFDL